MVEIHKHPDHPEGMAERIAKRLRNSGGDGADVTVQKGSSPNRTFTNIHHAANHLRPTAGPTAGDVRKPSARPSDYDADDVA